VNRRQVAGQLDAAHAGHHHVRDQQVEVRHRIRQREASAPWVAAVTR